MRPDNPNRSMKPDAVRKRLRNAGKRGDQAHHDLAVVYQKPIEEWDFEELQRGKPRNVNGKFSGARPKWISPTVMAEAQKRLREVGQQELGRFTGSAIKVMVELMEDSRLDLVRFQAAKYVLDQIIGVPVNKVEIEGNVSFKGLLAAVMVNPDGQVDTDDEVIDAEIVEDDDDDGE